MRNGLLMYQIYCDQCKMSNGDLTPFPLTPFPHRGTRRGIAEIMSTILNLDISLGAICRILERVSLACAPETEHIRENIAEAQSLNIDETGWKSAGNPRWLWVFVSSVAVFFRVASSRGSQVLQSVLGETFSGIITSDDHSAYNKYHN